MGPVFSGLRSDKRLIAQLWPWPAPVVTSPPGDDARRPRERLADGDVSHRTREALDGEAGTCRDGNRIAFLPNMLENSGQITNEEMADIGEYGESTCGKVFHKNMQLNWSAIMIMDLNIFLRQEEHPFRSKRCD